MTKLYNYLVVIFAAVAVAILTMARPMHVIKGDGTLDVILERN